MTKPEETLLLLVARAYRRLTGATMTLAPDYYDRERATALIEALDAEGLEIRPKELNVDSEEPCV